MTQYNYNYNSHEVASALIKRAGTAFLMTLLLACQETKEDISEGDRQELEQLLSEVA